MATDITFGVKTNPVDINKVDSGALGNAENSTPAVATQPKTEIPSGPMSPNVNLSGPMSVNPVNSSVDTTQLESASSSGVVLPQPTQTPRIQTSTPSVQDQATAELDRITGEAKDIQSTLDKNKEQYDLQDTQKKSKEDISTAFDSLASLGEFEAGLGDEVQLQRKRELKTEIDNKILKKERDFDLAIREAEDTFGTRAQKNAIKSEITKNYNRELADLSIIQMARAGEYNDAKSYVDQKVQLEMQDRKANLDKLMFFYAENKERLTELDQRAFQAKILQDERAYQEQLVKTQNFENFRFGLIQAAISAGAGNGTLASLQSATSMEELIQRDLSIFAPKATGSSEFAVPTVKEINGVDMQWNPNTGQWEEISTGGSMQKVQQSLDQFAFLRTTVKDAQKLASAAGPNKITQWAGNLFVGDTEVKRLQNKLDSLKVNLLALNTDPSVKEFFGPQMSDNDSRLLLSAGSTMDAYSNNATELKSELTRYDNLINRMETAVRQGIETQGVQGKSSYILTAPDGTQIEIID